MLDQQPPTLANVLDAEILGVSPDDAANITALWTAWAVRMQGVYFAAEHHSRLHMVVRIGCTGRNVGWRAMGEHGGTLMAFVVTNDYLRLERDFHTAFAQWRIPHTELFDIYPQVDMWRRNNPFPFEPERGPLARQLYELRRHAV